MRNRQSIEREIYRAREDLEDSLAQLRHVVQEKVDIKARARVAVAKGKVAAHDAFDSLYGRAKDRPVLVGSIVGGLVAVGVLAYVGRQRDWW